MGAKDIAEKNLEAHNDVFADIVNMKLFDGEQVIHPDALEDALLFSQYKADDNELHEQERDVCKYWNNGSIRIAFCGIENQSVIDKDMPIRCISYDGAAYRNQMAQDEIVISESGNRYRKRGKRYPVVTLVMYFGTEKWNKPLTLYDMMDVPEKLRPFVNDYKINLVQVAHLDEADLEKFHSDFRVIAEYFVKSRLDKDYRPEHKVIKHVDEVLKLMTVLTGDARYVGFLKEVPANERGEITMCEVMDRAEQRGEELGANSARIESIRNLMKNTQWTAEKAMENLGIDKNDFQKYKDML